MCLKWGAACSHSEISFLPIALSVPLSWKEPWPLRRVPRWKRLWLCEWGEGLGTQVALKGRRAGAWRPDWERDQRRKSVSGAGTANSQQSLATRVSGTTATVPNTLWSGLALFQDGVQYETGRIYLIVIILKISQCLPRSTAVVSFIWKSSSLVNIQKDTIGKKVLDPKDRA